MNKSKLVVAVQLVAHGDEGLSFSSKERRQVQEEFAGQLDVRWLPTIGGTRIRKQRGLRYTLESQIAIFLLGVAFISVVKPFLESASKEAGKDFWKLIKSLVGKIWKAQANRSYHLNSKIWIVFDLGENSLFVEFRVSDVALRDHKKDFDKYLEHELISLACNWNSIQGTIKRLALDKHSPDSTGSGRFILRHGTKDDKWEFDFHDSTEQLRFFR